MEKLRADLPALRRPAAPSHVAFVLDETVITEALIAAVGEALLTPGKRFLRVAIIGADRKSIGKLKKMLSGLGFALAFFEGIENAKEWLCSETDRQERRK